MRTWLPLSIFTLVASSACGPAAGTEGASCPNSNNCIAPLQCIEGICQMAGDVRDGGVPRDGGPLAPRDGGPRDGGAPVYLDKFNSGTVTVTPFGMMNGFDQLAGRAAMVRETTGYTSVRVEVTGLTPSTMFASHVHNLPCSNMGGGGHYQIDDTVMGVDQANEIWPTITADANGNGTGSARINHYARTEAQSVVIHEPANAERIGCIDLAPNADVTASGTFAELPTGMGSGITGTAELRRYQNTKTSVTVTLMGTLMADTQYPTHVHAQPCAMNMGGPHYKIDTAIQDAMAENEIWPMTTANTAGTMANGVITVDHLARFDAYAVVVHDPVSLDRLICADLIW